MKMALRYNCVFDGYNGNKVYSLARFPIANFKKVTTVLLNNGYLARTYGMPELNDKKLFYGIGGWFMVECNDNESMYNICQLGTNDSISYETLNKLVKIISDTGVKIKTPSYDMENIVK